jgi:predicted dehydrogenase
MGRRHVHAIKQLGWQLVGVTDVSPESLRLAAQEHQLENYQLFTSLDALLKVCNPDLVVIATNADSHCMLTCQAAKRGVKYILCEKPMAVSITECDRMLDACRVAGARLSINHQMRFMPTYTVPKALFQGPEFGGLCSMTVIAGNFGFAMNGSHYFEAFRFLTDEMPVEVSAWFSSELVPNPRGPQYRDRAGCIRAVTSSGKRLYMDVSADQGHGFGCTYACRYGIITLNELSGELASSEREAQYRDLPTTRYGMPCINKRYPVSPPDLIDTTSAVLQALVTDKISVSGEVGRQVVELLVAVHQSAEKGGAPVSLTDAELDRKRAFPWA